jgi:N-methylhydantoinase A/oxoprolinase/acetone carboxylase beta subunit
MTFDGPAIIEQMDATTVVPPGAAGRIDDAGNIHITLGG